MLLVFLSLLALGLVFCVVTIWNLSTVLPRLGDSSSFRTEESTKIYSSDGALLAVVYADEHREYVPLRKIPAHVREATVAAEDKRFYSHSGVDVRGIGRALWEDLRSQRRSQGGSTITMQLARNLFLSKRKVVSRKLQEAIISMQLERRYTKDEILELYLNQVYYGAGAYGVQAAAKVYFGKDVSDLTLAESALLAGLPQRPTAYSPYKGEAAKEAAKGRRDVILGQMGEQGYISPRDLRKALDEPIKLRYRRPSMARVRRAPYFVDYVVKELEEKYGEDLVYTGGLRVVTSLNSAMQAEADKALKDGVREARGKNVSEGALVCVDPYTGYIRAMVGGVDYERSQLNHAYLKDHPRSPGSTFKPFVYAAAFENGITPEDRVVDGPVSYPGGPRGPWRPRNYDDRWHGNVSIRRAIANSYNIPAIKTLDRIGINKAIEMAQRLGIKSPLRHDLTIAIGTSETTLLEITSAYGAFATKGFYTPPLSVLKVEDRSGQVLEENQPSPVHVLAERPAKLIDDCLRAVVTEGTARQFGGRIADARGKTGTSQKDRDAWFIGYTPELVTGVWFGNDQQKEMRQAFGGSVCSPVWARFMERALRIQTRTKHPKLPVSAAVQKGTARPSDRRNSETEIKTVDPGTVAVPICEDSGMVATGACPNVHLEQFERGTAPTESCTLHPSTTGSGSYVPTVHDTSPAPAPDTTSDEPPPPRAARREPPTRATATTSTAWVVRSICAESGDLATEYCPETRLERMPANRAPTTPCRLHGPDTR
ncbi:MAG TPA: penicillin-binding protein 1A [Armatimonadota bacterium]|jgi:penicillin-binding protein 1A